MNPNARIEAVDLFLEEYWEMLMSRHAEDCRDPKSCDYNYVFTKDPDGHEIVRR